MAKKVIRRKSSSRRIAARPLSFWHFIRKNFLIIAGLLLLPVTVGAVVSSYNYANQGSAAALKTQNNIYRGNSKRATLKTQDAAPPTFCATVANNGGRWCGSNIDQCQTCFCSGDLNNSDASDDGCAFTDCIPRHQIECGYITPIPPTVGPKSCVAGNGGSVADGNYAWAFIGTEGCRFCDGGVWEAADAVYCGGVPPTTAPQNTPVPLPTTAGYTPPPRQEPTSAPARGGIQCPGGYCRNGQDYGNDLTYGGSNCGERHAWCNDKGGFDRDKDDLPRQSAGFDVGKAIRNFFGFR